MKDLFLADLERDAASTRRVLERVPEGKNDWAPHPRSMHLGYLAGLVATMPSWAEVMIHADEFDVAPPGGTRYRAPEFATRAELLAEHDRAVAVARAALESTNDEHLLKSWRFLVTGHVATESPRYVALRDSLFNHVVHHRGQLTVYLRLNEALVPGIYGPSADEKLF